MFLWVFALNKTILAEKENSNMVSGRGSPETVLIEAEVEVLIEEGIPKNLYAGKKVLVLTPDTTRTCPLPAMIRAIGKIK
jgi:hypothetical protein